MMEAKKWPQYCAAFTISLGAWGYGTVLGWTSNITDHLKKGDLNGVQIKDDALSWIVSSAPLGAIISCLFMGVIADEIGRKCACIISIFPSIAGWTCITLASSVRMACIGRFLTGFGSGGFVVIAPVYATEIAEISIRGICGLLLQVLLIFGIVYANIFGWLLPMVYFNISCTVIPLIFGLLFLLQPETPFFYLKWGQREKAEASLKRLRGKDYDTNSEIEAIILDLQQRPARDLKTIIKKLRSKTQVHATVSCFMLMFFQKYTGVNIVIFYTKQVFISSNISIVQPFLGVILTGLAGSLGTFVSLFLVDSVGRIILLGISSGMCAFSSFFIGLYFTLQREWSEEKLKEVDSLPVIGMMLFLFSFNVGIGPIPWLLCSELWDPSLKTKMGALACAFNWSQAFFVSKFYLEVSSVYGIDNVFYTFSLISTACLFYVIIFVPETGNKKYEEILEDLNNIFVRC